MIVILVWIISIFAFLWGVLKIYDELVLIRKRLDEINEKIKS